MRIPDSNPATINAAAKGGAASLAQIEKKLSDETPPRAEYRHPGRNLAGKPCRCELLNSRARSIMVDPSTVAPYVDRNGELVYED